MIKNITICFCVYLTVKAIQRDKLILYYNYNNYRHNNSFMDDT